MDSNTIALYYHIPFCARKCFYCAFYSVPWATEEDKDAYLKALCRQTVSFPESRPVSSVYFGGGTPNLFGAERLSAVLDAARNYYPFRKDCEITVEVNPGSVTAKELMELREAGVNRLSIGMQSSDDRTLKRLGRTHSFSDVVQCVENARTAGFQNLSLDLLFALPGQSREEFRRSVQDAIDLTPEHMSVYSLQIEEGTAFFMQRDRLELPTEDEEELQYEDLCSTLSAAGFLHYEISSFAKAGKESRHNMHYWQRGQYLGFGPAAHSFWNGKRFSNTADVKAYIHEPLRSNDYGAAERITDEEAAEETIMLGLRTREGIGLNGLSEEVVQRMCLLGYLTVEEGRVRMTEKGWRVSNAVIGQLLV